MVEPERDIKLYGSNKNRVQLFIRSQHHICLAALIFTAINPVSLLQSEVIKTSFTSTVIGPLSSSDSLSSFHDEYCSTLFHIRCAADLRSLQMKLESNFEFHTNEEQRVLFLPLKQEMSLKHKQVSVCFSKEIGNRSKY